MMILAIDPGNVESAYVLWNGKKVVSKGKHENNHLVKYILEPYLENLDPVEVVIEMVASYGMPVGKTVFDTCVWIGRFIQICVEYKTPWKQIYRIDVKNHICHSSRAKDSNVIQALVDRFGDVNKHGKYSKGTKKNPGFFFGFNSDIWQAFSVAVFHSDKLETNG